MNDSTLLISLGPTGEESVAVFLDLMAAYARRHEMAIPDMLQVLVRRSVEDHPSAVALDAKAARVTAESAGMPLLHTLPDLPWVDGFAMTMVPDHPVGFDRTGLAEKCWQEWVTTGVHDAQVPWYREIEDSLESLAVSSNRRGTRFNGVVNAYVIANLSDPQEAGIAHSLGAYLRAWPTTDVRPVLIASLSPRRDVSQVGDFAVGRAVAALHDLARDWSRRDPPRWHKAGENGQASGDILDETFNDTAEVLAPPEPPDQVEADEEWPGLGYFSGILNHGPMAESGRAVVELKEGEVAKVNGQVLYGLCVADSFHRQVVGDDPRHTVQSRKEPFLTVSAAGYWFSPEKFARYTALRLVIAACESGETDASLEDKVANLNWPPEGERDLYDAQEDVRRLQEKFANELRSGCVAIIDELGEIVARAGYREFLRLEVCTGHEITEWPQVIADLVGVVEQGVVEAVKPALRDAVDRQADDFCAEVTAVVRRAFDNPKTSGRLVVGTAVLGGLRLFEQSLPDICQAASERAFKASKAADTKQLNHVIERRYRKLCRDSRQPPHWSALIARASLVTIAATAACWAAGINFLGLEFIQPIESAIIGGIFGLISLIVMSIVSIAFRRKNCEAHVRVIIDKLGLRIQAQLHQARTRALESFQHQVSSRVHAALAPEASGSNSAGDGPSAAGSEVQRVSISPLHPILKKYARAWQQELQTLAEELTQTEQQYQNSTYLQAMPNIPGQLDRRSRASLERILSGAVEQLIGTERSAQAGPATSLAAVRACLVNRLASLWSGLLPSELADLPQQVQHYFDRLITTISDHLYQEYYRHKSIDDVLRQVPAELVKRLRSARDKSAQDDLDSPEAAIVFAASRRVLLQELFSQAGSLLAVPGLEIDCYFWLSPTSSHDEDFFLMEAGLDRQTTEESRVHTEDRSVAALLACSRRIGAKQLLESPGSWYRDRLERLRRKHPNHPELTTLSERIPVT